MLGYNYPGSTWYVAAYDKLKSHGLVNQGDEASANTDAVAPPPKPNHPWYWPF